MGARAYVKVDCSFLHGTLHYRGPHLNLALLGLLVGGVVRAAAHAHPPPCPVERNGAKARSAMIGRRTNSLSR